MWDHELKDICKKLKPLIGARADALWAASRIDEDWQIELWGEDEEASSANTLKFLAFSDALAFFMDCR